MENSMLDVSESVEPFDEAEVDEFDLQVHCTTGKRAPRARRYAILVDGERKLVESPKPTGAQILDLVGKCPESFFLQEVRTVGAHEVVDLRRPGVERFITIFKLHIEGKGFPWPHPTVTMEQIAALGGWNPSEGVIQVDSDQNETTIKPGQVVTLPTDCSFGKPLHWKRG
jgi:hypothetical protein